MNKTYIIDFDDLDMLMDHGIEHKVYWETLDEITLKVQVEMAEQDYNDFMNDWETDEEE